MPMNRRPLCFAIFAVVPEPLNGSSTTPAGDTCVFRRRRAGARQALIPVGTQPTHLSSARRNPIAYP